MRSLVLPAILAVAECVWAVVNWRVGDYWKVPFNVILAALFALSMLVAPALPKKKEGSHG